ncbi:MAG TPA: response regulator [Verrucomicrobium sp.]|nr:response regulator [Verrucomicrobium sp.]
MTDDSNISVVDDDGSVRESLASLLKSLGHTVEKFSAAESFLNSGAITRTDCLILDVRMPGMSGPDLQRELQNRGWNIPIIFMTAHNDAEVIARVTAAGAVDYLLKPFSEEVLLKAISRALLH